MQKVSYKVIPKRILDFYRPFLGKDVLHSFIINDNEFSLKWNHETLFNRFSTAKDSLSLRITLNKKTLLITLSVAGF